MTVCRYLHVSATCCGCAEQLMQQHGSELTKQSIELAVNVSYELCNFLTWVCRAADA